MLLHPNAAYPHRNQANTMRNHLHARILCWVNLLVIAIGITPATAFSNASVRLAADNIDRQRVSSVSEDSSVYHYVQVCNMISSDGNPEIFRNFRRIRSYVMIVEPTDFWIAEAYIQYIAKHFSWIVTNKTVLSKVLQIDSYGKPYMHDFVIESNFLIKASALALRFGAFVGKITKKFLSVEDGTREISSVLEIGGGFGGFAAIATDIFEFDSYTIVDIPEALNVQEKFLSHFPNSSSKINYLDGKKVHEAVMDSHRKVVPTTYDLCISTYAFSELVLEYRETYFELFVKNCKFGFFIDNGECFDHLKIANLKLGAAGIAKRLESTGLIETEVVDEVPSSSNGLNCKNYELYYWPKRIGKKSSNTVKNKF